MAKINTPKFVGIAPNLVALGITEAHLELFKKYYETSTRAHVISDPYLASTGNKAANTRAFNNLHRVLTDAGINFSVATMEMNKLMFHGEEKLHTGMEKIVYNVTI